MMHSPDPKPNRCDCTCSQCTGGNHCGGTCCSEPNNVRVTFVSTETHSLENEPDEAASSDEDKPKPKRKKHHKRHFKPWEHS